MSDYIAFARGFAMVCHEGQKYGKNDYYTSHVIPVFNKVDDMYSGDKDFHDLKVLATLHDCLGDSNKYTIEDYECCFTTKVVNALIAITKDKNESRNQYIERVKQNNLALKVKICDTVCNLEESIKIQDSKRIIRYSEQLAKLYK